MDFSDFKAHLVTEAARFRTAALAAGPEARVPACPDWNATGLIDHLTEVYDDKTLSMRLLRQPTEADQIARTGTPAERFDAALADLLAEFDDRGPESLSYTWYGPDQSTGFWFRRMAQETLVHRFDAEQAAGLPIGGTDPDLALDGIDEMLEVMIAWGSRAYRDHVADALAANAGLTLGLDAGDRSWTVRVGEAVDFTDGLRDAQAVVSGTPGELLAWVWRRLPVDALRTEGDPAAARSCYELLATFGQ